MAELLETQPDELFLAKLKWVMSHLEKGEVANVVEGILKYMEQAPSEPKCSAALRQGLYRSKKASGLGSEAIKAHTETLFGIALSDWPASSWELIRVFWVHVTRTALAIEVKA